MTVDRCATTTFYAAGLKINVARDKPQVVRDGALVAVSLRRLKDGESGVHLSALSDQDYIRLADGSIRSSAAVGHGRDGRRAAPAAPVVTAGQARLLASLGVPDAELVLRAGAYAQLLHDRPAGLRADVLAVGGAMHDQWRFARPKTGPGGTYEVRMKPAGDGTEVDIANTAFADLPPKYQQENLAAGAGALAAASHAWEASLWTREERVARVVHEQWLARNKDWAPPEQSVPYADLSEAEKDKDRILARDALAVVATRREPTSANRARADKAAASWQAVCAELGVSEGTAPGPGQDSTTIIDGRSYVGTRRGLEELRARVISGERARVATQRAQLRARVAGKEAGKPVPRYRQSPTARA